MQADRLFFRQSQQWHRWLIMAAVLLLVTRLAMMWLAPLADTTEARYGELARQTVSNGYWLMPHMDANTPFFAKPPLSTWTSAASMQLFGVNEFAARLPALLASMLTAWVTLAFARAWQLRDSWLVMPVLAASPLFYLSAGTVMTDAVQMAVVTAALYFAWRALEAEDRTRGRRWRLAFWAMVGVGALSKGLATWALIGLPLATYGLVQRRPLRILRQLFDLGGAALAAAIFLPWYLVAERHYPGFLNYFIVGEHFSRFLVPGWAGDRYGTTHRQPLGAIWVFWAAAILPWSGVFLTRLYAAVRSGRAGPAPLPCFLWCATLAPLAFFTLSRNIIWTYALTAVPPFAVLVAHWLQQAAPQMQRRTAAALALYAAAMLLVSPLVLSQMNAHSERSLVQAFDRVAPDGAVLQYRTKPAFSSAFYTHGLLQVVQGGAPPAGSYVVLDNEEVRQQAVPADRIVFVGANCTLVRE